MLYNSLKNGILFDESHLYVLDMFGSISFWLDPKYGSICHHKKPHLLPLGRTNNNEPNYYVLLVEIVNDDRL